MVLNVESRLSEFVTHRPGASKVFERLGLDYCCGGKRTLREACAARSLKPDEVLQEALREETAPSSREPDWSRTSMTALAEHIVERHHGYLRREMPRLSVLLQRVARVHGTRHPELFRLQEVFGGFVSELNMHMLKEESILFPAIRQVEAGEEVTVGCGELEGPICQMEREHDQAGAALHEMERLTGGYRAPEEACESYRALMDGLQRLEADMHLHVHKENNVLFPRAVEARRRGLEVG